MGRTEVRTKRRNFETDEITSADFTNTDDNKDIVMAKKLLLSNMIDLQKKYNQHSDVC